MNCIVGFGNCFLRAPLVYQPCALCHGVFKKTVNKTYYPGHLHFVSVYGSTRYASSYIERFLRFLEEVVSERPLGEFLLPHCGRGIAALHQIAEKRSHDGIGRQLQRLMASLSQAALST